MTDLYNPLTQTLWWNQQRQRVEIKANVWEDERLFSTVTTKQEEQTTVYYRGVPWLTRAIEMRANAVASVPWRLMRGETEVDNSATWADKQKMIPDPYRLLWLVEAALCFGPAYVWRERNRTRTTGLRYVVASTIKPKIDERQGLTGFTRQLGARQIDVPVDELLYFWKPDPFVELGPPLNTPVASALAAAGVLYNLSQFAAAFWARGAIKATILTVDGNPTPEAKSDLKKWWQRAVTGINNAFASNVVSASVKPVVVGEGLESLQNTALTATQREDVSTALGIPQTLLFSTGAGGLGGGGVVAQDDAHFYSKTVIPECEFIAGEFNRQLWQPLGLRMEFQPETLDVFQADENERATSFKTYVDAGLPKSLVAEMLGLELPDGWEYDDLDPKEPEPAPVVPPVNGAVPGGGIQAEVDAIVAGVSKAHNGTAPREVLDDLRKWRAKSTKRGGVAPFESDVIPVHIFDTVREIGFDWLANYQDLKAKQPDRGAEEQLRKALAKLLKEQRDRIAAQIAAGEPVDWAAVERELGVKLTPALAKIATDQAIAAAVDLGIGFDVATVNLAAWKWASNYSYELIKGITSTSRDIVANAVTQFIATPGMTVGDLAGLLDSAFGDVRAQMIAVTETTRAYSQATTITQAMLHDMGVEVKRVWQTSADEKVCEICAPLDGRKEGDWEGVDEPPAHVNCRCWMTTEVVR